MIKKQDKLKLEIDLIKEKNSQLEVENKKLEAENKKLSEANKKNVNLENELSELKKKQNTKDSPFFYFTRSNATNSSNGAEPENAKEYDLVIDFPAVDLFRNEKAVWLIYISKLLETHRQKSDFNSKKPLNSLLEGYEKFTTISFIGSFNKGKTFLINLLNNYNLPSGVNTQTKGLSFVISHGKESLYIDTAGINTCISLGEVDNSQENLARKKSTELFVQEVAISLSNVIVLVVTELNWLDQQSILALQNKLQILKKETNESKQLIVVHNYSGAGTFEQLVGNIKTYINSPFKGDFHKHHKTYAVKKEDVLLFYTEHNNMTNHFFLCNNNTEFGNKWNAMVSKKIISTFRRESGDLLSFDEKLTSTLQFHMSRYCKSPKELTIVPVPKDYQCHVDEEKSIKRVFTISRENDISASTNKILHEIENIYQNTQTFVGTITQIPAYAIHPLEQADRSTNYQLKDDKVEYTVEYQIIVASKGFKPNYDKIIKKNGDLFIIFELAQLSNHDVIHSFKEDPKRNSMVLRVKGTKELKCKNFSYPNENSDLIPSLNPRREGTFEEVVEISSIYSEKYLFEWVNGVLIFKFVKRATDNNAIEGIIDDDHEVYGITPK